MTMLKLNGRNKAQFFSVDLVVAILLFITIIISSIYIWDYSKERIFLAEKRNNLNLLARNTLSSLVETSGNPSNWSSIPETEFNENNILSLGLLKSHSLNNYDQIKKSRSGALGLNNLAILDKNKIETLSNFNNTKYETQKKILGLLGPNYNFELQIKKWNETAFEINYNIGIPPTNESRNIVRLDRFALLDDEYVNVIIKVWEK